MKNQKIIDAFSYFVIVIVVVVDGVLSTHLKCVGFVVLNY